MFAFRFAARAIWRYGLLVYAVVVACALALLLRTHSYDDPFITFRYAQNLATSQGFVYNPGVRVLSTTSPLYALILVIPAWLGWSLPVVGNIMGCVAVALGGAAWWQLGQRWQQPVVGAVGAALYPILPLVVPTVGSETPLYLAALLWSFVAFAKGWQARLGVLLGMAVLLRADALLAVALLAVAWLLRQRRMPWRALGVGLLVVGPWVVWATWYFGSPLPATLAAKIAQGRMQGGQTFAQGLSRLFHDYWQYPIYRPHLVLMAFGGAVAVWRRSPWGWLMLWSAIYALAYSLLGVSRYFWYYAPLAPGLVAALGLALATLAAWLPRRWAVRGPGAALAALLLLPPLWSLRYTATHPDLRVAPYRAVSAWLQTNTAPDATVGTLEVGMIGYWSERPLLDWAGLLQPQITAQLTSTASYDSVAAWAVATLQPDYVVASAANFPQLNALLAQRCRRAADFPSPTLVLAIHDCRK